MKKMNLLLSSLMITSMVAFTGCGNENSSVSCNCSDKVSSNTSTVITNTPSDDLTEQEFKVTYIPNNGEESKTRPAYYGDLLIQPGSYVKEYYELEGWYLDEEFNVRWNFTVDTVESDITLYAKWVIDFDDWIWRLARLASKSTVMYVVNHYKTEADYKSGVSSGAGAGSGVVIAKEEDPADGNTYFYALTNNHVVSYSEEKGGDNNQEEMVDTYYDDIKVYDHYNNIYQGELIAKTNTYDLALVRFRNKAVQLGHWGNTTNDKEIGIRVSEFAKEDPEVGLDVASYGAPLAQPQVCTIGNVTTYTSGTISQKPNGVSYITTFDIIEHTADILSGNSGGPLFGPDLSIVGINYGSSGYSDTFTTGDKFWAVPVTKVKEFVRNRDSYLVNDVYADRFGFLDEIAKENPVLA